MNEYEDSLHREMFKRFSELAKKDPPKLRQYRLKRIDEVLDHWNERRAEA